MSKTYEIFTLTFFSPFNPTLPSKKAHSIIIVTELSALVNIFQVSNAMLMQINLRMQEIFRSEEVFGGVLMLVFGDMLQLEPVKAMPPYVPLTPDQVSRISGNPAVCSVVHCSVVLSTFFILPSMYPTFSWVLSKAGVGVKSRTCKGTCKRC